MWQNNDVHHYHHHSHHHRHHLHRFSRSFLPEFVVIRTCVAYVRTSRVCVARPCTRARVRACAWTCFSLVVPRCKPSVELSWLRQSRATTGTAATGTSAHRRGTRAPCGGGTVEVEERTLLVKRQRCCTTFSSRGTSNTAATSLARLLSVTHAARGKTLSACYLPSTAVLPDRKLPRFSLLFLCLDYAPSCMTFPSLVLFFSPIFLFFISTPLLGRRVALFLSDRFLPFQLATNLILINFQHRVVR